MGIQLNGGNDVISAVDGSLTVEGLEIAAGIATITNIRTTDVKVSGILTATALGTGFGVGIKTAGGTIGYGFTVLNFVGSGNTFATDGTTVDISIAGGGGGGGGGSNGIGTALGDEYPLTNVFKTPQILEVGAATTIAIESDLTHSGGIAYMREDTIAVGSGATVRVASGTTVALNVFSIFKPKVG